MVPGSIAEALDAFPHAHGAVRRLGNGLINDTYKVEGPANYVLQKVNPIFRPEIHHNIQAVTRRLSGAGLTTPELVESSQGRPWAELEDGSVWRLMTFIDGVSFDAVDSRAQAHAAGELVAHVHRALEDLQHEFQAMRRGVHDTPEHLRHLEVVVQRHPEHRLYPEVETLAESILAAASALPPLPDLGQAVCHGDLKLNNMLFDRQDPTRALCLVDLDTVGPMSLAHELGDAWRSWCNRGARGEEEAAFDLAVFEASLMGYLKGRGRELTRAERDALLIGVEWISLELAARFAADALAETYFGWDHRRFATRGDHNLARARGQWALHEQTLATRGDRARLLRS